MAPAYLYRFDYATPLLRLLLVVPRTQRNWATCGVTSAVPATSRCGWAAPRPPKAVSKRMRTRWVNFATHAKPTGLEGEPEWLPYQLTDRPCLLINERDKLVYDVDKRARLAWGDEPVNFR